MEITAKNIARAFAAGSFGGLIRALIVYFLGALAITEMVGVNMAPGLSAAWLYPLIVWGGIWGFLLMLPIGKGVWSQGFVISLAPSAMQLFYWLPQTSAGMMGLNLGVLTPLVVIFFNLIWGWVAAGFYRASK